MSTHAISAKTSTAASPATRRRILPLTLLWAVLIALSIGGTPAQALAADDPPTTSDESWVRLADGTRLKTGPTTLPKFGRGYVPPDNIDEILEERLKVYPVVRDDLPPFFDWRDHGGVTSVKNQGSCGSCWAFGATAELESYILINYGQNLNLSEQQVMDCNPWDRGCDGGWSGTAYYVFNTYGAVLEPCLPYLMMDGYPCRQGEHIPFGFIPDWHSVSENHDQMKAAILEGPLCTSIDASHEEFDNLGTGCYTLPGYTTNHLVLIVGYDDRLCDGAGAWIIKNSWGTNFGEAGYGYIQYGAAAVPTSLTQLDYLPPPVTVVVTAPGGQPIMGEAATEITWFTDGPTVNNVDIWFSLSSGCHNILLAENTPNDGSFIWNVPNTATQTGSLTIFPSTGTEDGYGFSNAPLVILGHKVRYVSETGSNTPPYESPATAAHSINDAVLACTGHDSVLVAGGDYLETVTVNSTVQLYGGYAADFSERDNDVYTTRLRGLSTALRFNSGAGDYAGVDGFTFHECRGAIYSDPVSGRHGGAVFVRESQPTISNCEFVDNNAASGTDVGYGGSIIVYGGGGTVENCSFTGNTASRGGAIAIVDAANVMLRGNTFDGNLCSTVESDYVGAAVYVDNSQVTLEDNQFLNNGSCHDGGAIFAQNSSLVGTDLHLENNNSQACGGAIYAHETDLFLLRATVVTNQAGTGTGGGIHSEGGQIDLRNVLAQGNQSGSMGGGFYLNNATGGVIQNCLIAENTGSACAGLFLMTSDTYYLRNSSIFSNNGLGLLGLGAGLVGEYNNFWNNSGGDFGGTIVVEHGVFADPLFVDAAGGDFGLAQYSPCIDCGNPDALYDDPDASRSDIGHLGGPGATFVAPAAVGGASVSDLGGGTYRLSWSANSEPDIDHYVVYRDTAEVFMPGIGLAIAEVAHPGTSVDDTPPYDCYYLVAAVDADGHCGGYSDRVYTEGGTTPVGGSELPSNLAVARVAPNPFNPKTTITYDLPRSGRVQLRIYDLRGRLVRDLVDGQVAAGQHSVHWDGTDGSGAVAAAGVYFVRVDDGSQLATRKIVLAK